MSDEITIQQLAEAARRADPPGIALDPPADVSIKPGTVPEGWTPPAEEKPVEEPPVEEPPVEDVGAEARLRAFEDLILGKEAVRVDGKIERGIGSKFSLMQDADKTAHAALERLVEAERKLLKATGAMNDAKAEHAAALEAADRHAAS